nr:plastocyanin/azurin family copper-binding protein [uncultured Lichenicoccus sp.]
MRSTPLLLAANLAVCLALAAPDAHAASATIDQSGQVFSQKSIEIAPGETLTFANHDDVTHNISVFNEDDDATDLGLQKPGVSLVHVFDKAGRFKVRCSIHPGMKMVVNVK